MSAEVVPAMTDRAWLTVFATLADTFILSQPYDAEGAFMLLHALDKALDGRQLGGSLDAGRRHLIAMLDGRHQHREAARASMVRKAQALELLRRTMS